MSTFDSLFSFWMPVAGHLSFALTFLSYAQTNIIRLRLVAVCSLSFGLAYNGWVNFNMPPDKDIWLVVGWLAVFFLQNLFLLLREVRDSLEVSLGSESRELLVATFPKMHSRDWALLTAKARVIQYHRSVPILKVGDSTTSLKLILTGVALETRNDNTRLCQRGTLWGEVTYVMGANYFNRSPVTISAHSDTLTVYEWSYELLDQLCKHNLRLSAALQHGFVHSAAVKHGLLWNPPLDAKNDPNRVVALAAA